MSTWDLVNQDSGEKTWLTPPSIIEALGHFDTDPCVPDEMPWKTADRMITKAEDGRAAEWTGRVWLNPPYGREAAPFMRRMASHEGGGVALLFAMTDTAVWQDWIFPFADSVLFIRGRIKFCRADGTQSEAGMPAPSALIAYSRTDTEALRRSGISGSLVRLTQPEGENENQD